jgi:hypothetical protein
MNEVENGDDMNEMIDEWLRSWVDLDGLVTDEVTIVPDEQETSPITISLGDGVENVSLLVEFLSRREIRLLGLTNYHGAQQASDVQMTRCVECGQCAICLEENTSNVAGMVCHELRRLFPSAVVRRVAEFDGSAYVRLRCKHVFHEACLAPWLRRSRTCPLCRADDLTGR